MGISAGYAGMGGADAAILGAAGMNDRITIQLRGTAIAFAAEYVKQGRDLQKLSELAQTLEGALRSTRLVNSISDAKLDRLVDALYALLEKTKQQDR